MDAKEIGITTGAAGHLVSRLYAAKVLEVDDSVPFMEQFADDVKQLTRALLDAKEVLEKEYNVVTPPPRRATGGYSGGGGGNNNAPTPKQIGFAKRLHEERGLPVPDVDNMSRKEVADLISSLLGDS